MQEIMQNYCPVYRSGKLMKEGRKNLIPLLNLKILRLVTKVQFGTQKLLKLTNYKIFYYNQ